MKIGILSKNYAAKRLFLNKLPNATYKDIRFYNYYLWRNGGCKLNCVKACS